MFAQLIARLGVDVNPQLLELAFTHRSYAYENNLPDTNERLEFLGDAVLGLVVTEELYNRYPELDESKLSPLRSGIVNMRALAEIARELNLGQYMLIGKGEEVTGGREKTSLLADSLEALFGAIYLNHGFTQTTKVILNLIGSTIESAKNQGAGLDGKTALQEFAAARQIALPEYQISESGPDHDKSFIATAIVGGEAIAEGKGKSKRGAEQAAARTAFEILNARTS